MKSNEVFLSVILPIEVLMTIVYNVEAKMAVSRKKQHLTALNNMDKNPSMVFLFASVNCIRLGVM
jgi:hypothetical protein